MKHKWDVTGGIYFNGINNFVNLGTNIELLNNRSIFAIISPLPILTNTYETGFIINREVDNNNRQYCFYYHGKATEMAVIFQYAHNTTFYQFGITNYLPYRTEPYVVCYTEINNVCKIYVDGVLASADYTMPIQSAKPTAQTRIGMPYSTASTFPYKGTIYDIKLFNRGLSATEVKQISLKQGQFIPASCITNCVANWTFDDKSGTILTDKSVSGYNGTLTNFSNTTLGAGNAWIDKYNNSITQY